MCDNDRNGVIDKTEFSDVLRSLVEIARTTSLSDEQVTELIEGMFLVSRARFIIPPPLPMTIKTYIFCRTPDLRTKIHWITTISK